MRQGRGKAIYPLPWLLQSTENENVKVYSTYTTFPLILIPFNRKPMIKLLRHWRRTLRFKVTVTFNDLNESFLFFVIFQGSLAGFTV